MATGGIRSPPHASRRDAESVNENSLPGALMGTGEETFCNLLDLALNQRTNHVTQIALLLHPKCPCTMQALFNLGRGHGFVGKGISNVLCMSNHASMCAYTLLSPGVSAASQRGLGPMKGNTGYTDWTHRNAYLLPENLVPKFKGFEDAPRRGAPLFTLKP